VSNRLLEAVRVLDLGGPESDAVSRLFADLGADVLKIEPPDGSPARHAPPSVAGTSIPFSLHNANKRSAVLDPDSAADRDRLIELAGAADIVVDGGHPSGAATFGTTCAALAEQFGHLVALSVTDFGATGPYASWRATDPVLYAMSTALSRTGPTSGTPVLPADGDRVRDCRCPGGVGRAGRLLSPVAVWHRRIHRLSRGSRRSYRPWIRRSGRKARRPSG